MKFVYLLTALCFVCLHSEAQLFSKKKKKEKEQNGGENYTLILNRAEDDFERGSLSKIPTTLKRGFEVEGFSKEEEIKAHRLLTIVHLFSDKEKEAGEELVALLKTNPEHPIDESTDPEEFKYLYRKYRTKPIFRLSLYGGVTRTNVYTIRKYATVNTTEGEYDEAFLPGIGIKGGLSIDRELSIPGWVSLPGMEVSLGVEYSLKTFSSDMTVIEAPPGSSESRFSELTRKETDTFIDIPLLLRYTLPLESSSILPYVFAGAEGNLLISAARTEATRTGAQTISTATHDLLEKSERNTLNYSMLAGLGVKFKFKTHFFRLECRYAKGQTNLVNGQNRYADRIALYRLAQVDNNQSLDVLSVNFGYIRSIYSPKKYKRFRK